MKEFEQVLSLSWDIKFIDKIALFFYNFMSNIWYDKNFSPPLQGIINEDWCFSLYSAGNSLQVGKMISYLYKDVYSYFLNPLVAFISVHLRFMSETVPWQARTRMNTAVLLEGGFFAPLWVRQTCARIHCLIQYSWFPSSELGKLASWLIT